MTNQNITLAVRYRPKTFHDVTEQSSQIQILEHQIKTGTHKNAYLFSGHSGCVDEETEYLTRFGWKKISEYSGEEIAVYNKTGHVFFETPSKFHKYPATKWFEIISKYGINQKLSEEHRVPYITSKGNLYDKTMQEVYDNHIEAINGFSGRFITSFKYNGDLTLPFSDDYLRLLVALSADGILVTEYTGYWEVHIKRERKVERLESLLRDCKIEYKKMYQQSDESFRYWFYCKDGFREFPTTWYRLNRRQLEVIGEECLLWDGSVFERKHGLYERYSTTKKCNADFIQFVFTTCGYRSAIYHDHRNKYKNGVCYEVSRTKRVLIGIGGNAKVDIKTYNGKDNEYKYCFTTSTSYWIARRGDRIFVTGNCGKTTVARIFANELNKGEGQPIEMDAARNNGVEDVRKMIDDASYKSLSGKYRIYIIDECHMFSIGAWNAMLKLLEEPPSSTIFILCTTDPQKIPATIINRVQRYDFKKISHNGIFERLHYIINQEELSGDRIKVRTDSIDFIAKLSEGGMRDAISALDKCLSFSKDLTIENVTKALGRASYESMILLLGAIEAGNKKNALKEINQISESGTDLKQFLKQFYLFLVDINKYILLEDINETKIPAVYEKSLKDLDADIYLHFLKEFMSIYEKLKYESECKELLTAKVLLLCSEDRGVK